MLTRIKELLFENRSARQTVLKNTFWLGLSNFGGRAFKAIVVIYGARVLGTAGWGVFSYATTLAGFLTLFMDPGINSVLIRETAKSGEDERIALLSTTFFIKLALIAIGIFVVIFIGPFFSTLPGATQLLPIVALIITFDTLREFFSAYIRGRERMEMEAGILLFTNAAIVAFGFLFLHFAATPMSLGIGYTIGSALGAAIAIIILYSSILKLFSRFSWKRALPLIKSAWPFAIVGALGLLLTNTDILIISWMRSASEVGIYAAAIRIAQLFYLIPTVIQMSTMPILSRLARVDNPRFRVALERITSLTYVAAVPLAIGGAILGTQVMGFVFGPEYAAGGLAFKILMLTMLADYPAAIMGNAIFAYDHQKSLIISSGIAGGLNVALDLLLIPHYGIVGSAVATLIAQGASQGYMWHIMKKINYFEVLPYLRRIVLAGVLMGFASAILIATGTPVLLNVAISTLFYLLLLKALREPLLGEVKNILRPATATITE